MRGDGARLGNDLLAGEMEGGARHGGGARAAGPFAEEHLVGVALDVGRLARIDAEPVADDLLERGFVSLALGVGAGEQEQRTVAVETHFGALEADRGRAFDGVGEAKAAQLAALSRLRLARLEALRV